MEDLFVGWTKEESIDKFENLVHPDDLMPIMNGLEATRQIRSLNRPDALAVPIIAMSANAFKEDIQKSLEAGMNAHLIKPLDGTKVTDTMKTFLANKITK